MNNKPSIDNVCTCETCKRSRNDLARYLLSKEIITSSLSFRLFLKGDDFITYRNDRGKICLHFNQAKPGCVFLCIEGFRFYEVYEVNSEELIQIIQLWLDHSPTRNISFQYGKETLNSIWPCPEKHLFSLLRGEYRPLIAAIIDYDEFQHNLKTYRIKELDGELFLLFNILDFVIPYIGKIAYNLTEKMSKYIIKHQKYLYLSHLTVRELYSIIFLDLLPCPIKIEYLCWYEILACVITNGLAKQVPPTSWTKFLTQGIYDPRLFLLIFAFAN